MRGGGKERGSVLRRGTTAALVLAPVLVLGACATITYEAPLIESMVAMNRVAPPAAYEQVGEFELDRRAVFVVAQLITIMDAELEEALRRELARTGGDAVINLRIHEEYDIIDVVIAAIVGGLVNSRAITFRGDVIRWTGDDGAPEELLELSDRCRPIVVPAGDGTARTAHACMP